MPPIQTPQKSTENMWHEPLQVFGKMSAWVAAPIVAALFIGRYLDERFGTAPWIFLGMTGFAFIISCYGIYREATRYLSTIEEKKNDTSSNTTGK